MHLSLSPLQDAYSHRPLGYLWIQVDENVAQDILDRQSFFVETRQPAAGNPPSGLSTAQQDATAATSEQEDGSGETTKLLRKCKTRLRDVEEMLGVGQKATEDKKAGEVDFAPGRILQMQAQLSNARESGTRAGTLFLPRSESSFEAE